MKPGSLLDNFKARLSYNEATFLLILAMSSFLLSSLWFGQSLIFYLIVLAISGALIFVYPQAGLFSVLVCTMVFEKNFSLQELQLGTALYKIYPLDFILFFIGLRLVIFDRQHIADVFRQPVKWFDVPMLVFALLCVIAYLRGVFGNASDVLAFSTLKNYIGYGVVYFYATVLLRTEDDWRECMRWFSFGAVAVFFFLFYGLVTGHGLWSEFTPLSTAGDRLIAGTHIFYLVLFGFWVLSWYVFHRPSLVSNRDSESTPLLLSLLLLVCVGVLVSLVRHLWVAIVCVFALWLLLLPAINRKRLLSLCMQAVTYVVLVGLIFMLVISFTASDLPQTMEKLSYVFRERVSVSSVISLEDTSFAWRVDAWRGGYKLWQQNPVFGVGFGKQISFVLDSIFFKISIRDMHNTYLGILAQMGLLGLSFVVVWFVALGQTMLSLMRRCANAPVFFERLLWTAFSGWIVFLIGFAVSVYWDLNLFIIFFWWLLAMARFVVYSMLIYKR